MEQCAATGGFKSLRSHVQASKDSVHKQTRHRLNGDADPEDVTELEEGHDEKRARCRAVAEATLCQSRQQLWEEEQQLNALRTTLVKEQKSVKERERAVKATETSLQVALEQAADKERQLDARIAEIARLESRLHEALQQYTVVPSPPAPAHEANNWGEREAALSLQEQELALARGRIEDREKHLKAKERILRDKEAELLDLQSTTERKRQEHIVSNEALTASALQARAAAVGQAKQQLHADQQTWRDEKDQQLADIEEQRCQIKLWRSQLFERESFIVTAESALAGHEALLAARESMLADAEAALSVKSAEWSQRQEQQLMLYEDYLARCIIKVEQQLGVLNTRLEELNQDRESLHEAETHLQHRENRLLVFAQEVELQHRANAQRQAELAAAALKAPTVSSDALGGSKEQTSAVAGTKSKDADRLRIVKLAKKTKSAFAIK